MCGIAGFWNFRSGRPADPAVLQACTRTLIHRGPDEEGYWVEGTLGLGMRRLQVVDPEGGHQPMPNETGTVQVVFNGEIYNHAALRRELEARGHRFRTRSDTEAIVHAYEEWGPECVERFNGMFAFAVWDAEQHTLLLARDRLGIKPLYVWNGAEGIVFGSELKAVAAAPWVPLEWDLEAVDDFLTYEYIPAPRTILSGVTKLGQGTWLRIVADGRIQHQRYWRLTASKVDVGATPAASAEMLRETLTRSVQRRLMADVPLGAFLSGGIDSSIIVGLMSGLTPGRVRTYSLGFEDRSYNELAHARTVASHFGTHHREDVVTPDIAAFAERLAHYYDEPFGDVSAFPTFLISSLARQEVTVALSGDGGDELFAGYDHYRAQRWAQRLSFFERLGGWRVVDSMLDRVPPAAAKKGARNKAKRYAEGFRRPADLEHARWLVFWDLAERRELYDPAVLQQLRDRDCFGFYRGLLREAGEHGFTGLQRQLYADVRGYLADDILAKVDRASMAVSLEVRVPFLDHEFVELAMSIPEEWKLHGSRTKWILRRTFSDFLPPSTTARGKEGFSMPMKNWLRGPLLPMMQDLLSAERLKERGWFAPAAVRHAMEEHVRGSHNHAHRLWCLMCLELSLGSLRQSADAARRGSALNAEPVAPPPLSRRTGTAPSA